MSTIHSTPGSLTVNVYTPGDDAGGMTTSGYAIGLFHGDKLVHLIDDIDVDDIEEMYEDVGIMAYAIGLHDKAGAIDVPGYVQHARKLRQAEQVLHDKGFTGFQIASDPTLPADYEVSGPDWDQVPEVHTDGKGLVRALLAARHGHLVVCGRTFSVEKLEKDLS